MILPRQSTTVPNVSNTIAFTLWIELFITGSLSCGQGPKSAKRVFEFINVCIISVKPRGRTGRAT